MKPVLPCSNECWACHSILSGHWYFTLTDAQDDMLFSEDFLNYMEAAAPLLDKDPSIWCISSWNDNGLNHLEWRNNRLVCKLVQASRISLNEFLLQTATSKALSVLKEWHMQRIVQHKVSASCSHWDVLEELALPRNKSQSPRPSINKEEILVPDEMRE